MTYAEDEIRRATRNASIDASMGEIAIAQALVEVAEAIRGLGSPPPETVAVAEEGPHIVGVLNVVGRSDPMSFQLRPSGKLWNDGYAGPVTLYAWSDGIITYTDERDGRSGRR